MAHIVKVRYGLSNLSKKEYMYIANNNVKRGTVIMPSVKHYQSGKVFATMGVVQHTEGGIKAKQELEKDFNKGLQLQETEKIDKKVVQSLRQRDEQGKYVYQENYGLSSKGKRGGDYAFANDKFYDRNNEAVKSQKQSVVNQRNESEPMGESFESYYNRTIGKKGE